MKSAWYKSVSTHAEIMVFHRYRCFLTARKSRE